MEDTGRRDGHVRTMSEHFGYSNQGRAPLRISQVLSACSFCKSRKIRVSNGAISASTYLGVSILTRAVRRSHSSVRGMHQVRPSRDMLSVFWRHTPGAGLPNLPAESDSKTRNDVSNVTRRLGRYSIFFLRIAWFASDCPG